MRTERIEISRMASYAAQQTEEYANQLEAQARDLAQRAAARRLEFLSLVASEEGFLVPKAQLRYEVQGEELVLQWEGEELVWSASSKVSELQTELDAIEAALREDAESMVEEAAISMDEEASAPEEEDSPVAETEPEVVEASA